MITKDHLINLWTQKLSFSLLVTTVWTLEASTCGPTFQASEGRLAQLMMILAVTAFLLLTMEILAKVFMNNFVSSHFFSIPFIRSALLCAAPAGVMCTIIHGGGSPGEGSLGTPIWLIYLFQIKKTQFFWESLKIATNFLGITNLGDFSWHWID